MRMKELYQKLESYMPLSLCEDWDNSGLLINADQDVQRILLALDITDAVIEEAIAKECDLIITHHPVIFKAPKKLDANDLVFKLIASQISVISMHTNLDAAEGGVNDVLADLIGVTNKENFADIGRMGDITDCETVEELARKVGRLLQTPLQYTMGEKKVKRIGLIGGSAGSYWRQAKIEGLDVFLTGEASHHDALDAMHEDVALIVAGHWKTEVPVLAYLQSLLQEEIVKGQDVAVEISERDCSPFSFCFC